MSKKKAGAEMSGHSEPRMHADQHHVYPTSRFILKKTPKKHVAWHQIFENKTPEEAMEDVETWMADYNKFRKEILDIGGKSEAWKLLFGKANFYEVLQIIQTEWTFPKVKMIKIKET